MFDPLHVYTHIPIHTCTRYSVPLSGCDLIYDGFNVKAAFFFRELLSPQLLKQSLAKALDGGFHILCVVGMAGSGPE